MKISYNWLNEYLPEKIETEQLSQILTSIGLEVESLEYFENIKGGLKDLIVGEVINCEQHPNADKLKVTKVNIGLEQPLQIVCGAPNVAQGQKVIVAPVGTTIFPFNAAPVTMKVAKIRGVESYGMICAEDEVGLSNNHEGILILKDDAKPGAAVKDLFNVYTDWIYEIGLTPNRMDAMSHLGVAKDVCAWLSYHQHKTIKPKFPFKENKLPDNIPSAFSVEIENTKDCKRYTGINISGITVKSSPDWLQNYLKAIGQRPINNIVDITNFILHETGQPLHAFDADTIQTKKIVVKNLPAETSFITLDGIERKLSAKDLMICDRNEPMCFAGVFGGLKTGVTNETKNIFLESAWFSPSTIRSTSLRYGLRTEAATRFEKGVDISATEKVLMRAVDLIKQLAGGEISSNVIDVFPGKQEKKQVNLSYAYLKKLSGKYYQPQQVKYLLSALEFDIINEDENNIVVAVPFSKPDISLPADIVEEIVRIDGLDNIEIPSSINFTPALQTNSIKEQLKEKVSQVLVGMGFNEIVTNSITNHRYFGEETLSTSVKLLNNLSADLDVMRPSMLETGLEIVAYNVNRKNNNLAFFEFGKVYHKYDNSFNEEEKLCMWFTGEAMEKTWNHSAENFDYYKAKGIIQSLLSTININDVVFDEQMNDENGCYQSITKNKTKFGSITVVNNAKLNEFDIKQPVFFAELNLEALINLSQQTEIFYKELTAFPAVNRDLAIIVDKKIPFSIIESALKNLNLPFLNQYHLFDVFESEKIGSDKKSLAINFRFQNKERTLTDDEVELMMKKIIKELEKKLEIEIRS